MTIRHTSRKCRGSPRMQCMPEGQEMGLEGFEVGRNIWKDNSFEVATRHVTVFHMSENREIVQAKPMLHGGSMVLAIRAIERRVANRIVGTIEVGADEEEDKK